MRVLIAPDKFKGTLSSADAAGAIAAGARKAWQRTGGDDADLDLVLRPLADGGEGSHVTLKELRPDLEERQIVLITAGGYPLTVPYLAGSENDVDVYYLETALVVGLMLVKIRETSIWDRTTRGIGEWILALTAPAAKPPILGLFLGGSATSDGGFGAARALGYRFLDREGNEALKLAGLAGVERITFPQVATPTFAARIFTDVQNPLTGPLGAARLFSPQKGASPSDVDRLEDALEHLRELLIERGSPDMNEIPGAGAAGGLGVPLLAHPGIKAVVESGSAFFLNQARIPELLARGDIDLVITGEGCTDAGTLSGKLVHTMQTAALANKIPTSVISGRVSQRAQVEAAGYEHLHSTEDICGPAGMLNHETAVNRLSRTAAEVLFQ